MSYSQQTTSQTSTTSAPAVSTVSATVGGSGVQPYGNAAAVAAMTSPTCAPSESATAALARQNIIINAVASVPVLDGVSYDTVELVEQRVSAAAGAAFDECLRIAVQEDPLGECSAEGASLSETVVADAERRYCAGPGLAVEKFGWVLQNTAGTSSPDGAVYSDPQVMDALAAYEVLLARSLQAYDIQNNPNITLATQHSSGQVDGANADENIQDVVEGCDVNRSAYGNAPGGEVLLSDEVLQALQTLGREFTFTVSELAGGAHSATSRHYAGVAIDVSMIDGAVANATNTSVTTFMERCQALGATEVLGPGDPGHATHVHAAWPRP